MKAILVAFTASAAMVALCQCERFCGSCTWQSPVLQNVISLTHFWAGSDPCSILRCWLSVWRALSVWEAICEKSPAGFRGKLITVLPYLHGIRGGLFPYDVDASIVFVLHSSFPPQGLCRFLMCHWKLLASLCLGAPADQRGHISDLFWVSVCLCHLLPGWARKLLCILLPCMRCAPYLTAVPYCSLLWWGAQATILKWQNVLPAFGKR